jgi:hypothetical protein
VSAIRHDARSIAQKHIPPSPDWRPRWQSHGRDYIVSVRRAGSASRAILNYARPDELRLLSSRNSLQKTGNRKLVTVPVKKDEQIPAEPPTAPGLFDMSAPVSARPTPPADSGEEAEILAEIKQDEKTEMTRPFSLRSSPWQWPRFDHCGQC